MKNIFKIGLIGLTCLSISSCKETRQIPGYDNTEEKFNTNLFYKNDIFPSFRCARALARWGFPCSSLIFDT